MDKSIYLSVLDKEIKRVESDYVRYRKWSQWKYDNKIRLEMLLEIKSKFITL